MKSFLEGFVSGGVLVFLVYHFGLQPLLQKWRDQAAAAVKKKTGV